MLASFLFAIAAALLGLSAGTMLQTVHRTKSDGPGKVLFAAAFLALVVGGVALRLAGLCLLGMGVGMLSEWADDHPDVDVRLTAAAFLGAAVILSAVGVAALP